MLSKSLINKELLSDIIDEDLRPFVRKIDEEAFYAKSYLEKLGQAGFFQREASEQAELEKRFVLIEETAKVCMTTAFCIWCHLAATTYVSHTENESLKTSVLPRLLSGELLAGTGLSNPLKSFAKLETLHLKAEKVRGGYIINGALPAVSNIGPGQAFAFIAELDGDEKVMGFVPCDDPALTLRARTAYIGLNGSATYSCAFRNLFLPDEEVIATNVDAFVQDVRTRFLAYQIPLALGVTASSVETMQKIALKYQENNINQYLQVQPEDLQIANDTIREQLAQAIAGPNLSWETLTDIRLDAAYITLDATQAAMLHHGGRGYVKSSLAERKLREAYFLVNLTPTIKHLETLKSRK